MFVWLGLLWVWVDLVLMMLVLVRGARWCCIGVGVVGVGRCAVGVGICAWRGGVGVHVL